MLYLEPNDVLSIHFSDVVISKDTIAGSRAVFDDLLDLSIVEGKAYVVGALCPARLVYGFRKDAQGPSEKVSTAF